MHPLLNIAVKAARAAGKIIVRAEEDVKSLSIKQKGLNDFVSQVDEIAEQTIIEIIHKNYPQHKILGEESGLSEEASDEDVLWIIDPLDGTTNFLHGFPQYAVSIAVKQHGKIQHAVVYDPSRDELFSATKGSGAQLNGKRIRVSAVDRLEKALLGTGFPYTTFHNLNKYLNSLETIMQKSVGIRRAGAAALDLAYVAAGRLDGFWEYGLKPWDIAAGSLLIQEAGGWVGEIESDKDFLLTGNIIGATPKIFNLLKEMLNK